jgi:aconitate hydratase
VPDPFHARATLDLGGTQAAIYRLQAVEEAGIGTLARLPFSIRILLENALRFAGRGVVTAEHVKAIAAWQPNDPARAELPWMPARVILQDFTGVPCVVDLAAMRDAMAEMGGDPDRINPVVPCDLVIDHSVQVDHYGTAEAFAQNMALEFDRNTERYQLLKFAQGAFKNFRAVPPGTGIVHQVNLEYLAPTVQIREQHGELTAYPDSCVGTDSHTTMINGLGVMGWGVGGIEAESVMLGQPYFMLIPDVIGVKLTGELPLGTTATDLVLTVTHILRKRGVVDKFVEFFGPGLSKLPLTDRATIANMAPEYGATMGFFPIDHETIRYLQGTGRDDANVAAVEAYAKAQGLWRKDSAIAAASALGGGTAVAADPDAPPVAYGMLDGVPIELRDGSVVIAAITSCTNTSNPSVLIGAGLLAKKAIAKGLMRKPWVKSSLAPGSRVVTDYLTGSGLQTYLDQLGFQTVGYGCTTCIGNSGPLPDEVQRLIDENGLVAAAVLSGNRNFEARVHPSVRANYLASPILVVAFALAGRVDLDLATEPIGVGSDGAPVYLADILPTPQEIADTMATALNPGLYRNRYASVFLGDERWQALEAPTGKRFVWDPKSTYVANPPFFQGLTATPKPVSSVVGARVLAALGDSVTTDHISPAGAIPKNGPAAKYLLANGIEQVDWNTFGSRRGHHEVMMRGTFGNVRIKNALVPEKEGNWTEHLPSGEVTSIYDAAMRYITDGTPLVILTGKEYGTGSSRDWAAKGTALLGVKAVIAESYERIHRGNLVGMGVLPLAYLPGQTRETLGLTGRETIDIAGVEDHLVPGGRLTVTATADNGTRMSFEVVIRLNSPVEVEYYQHGGILQRVLRQFAFEGGAA